MSWNSWKTYSFDEISSTNCLKQISSNHLYLILQNHFQLDNSYAFPKTIFNGSQRSRKFEYLYSNFVYSKTLETVCVTPRCCLYLYFEPLMVYSLIHTRKSYIYKFYLNLYLNVVNLYLNIYPFICMYLFMSYVETNREILCILIILEWMFKAGALLFIYLTPPFKIYPTTMYCYSDI